MIDDSELFHGTYDPVKAREYYLRTRKLKGRRPSTATPTNPGRGGRRPANAPAASGGTPNRADTKSRRAQLQAEKKALEKRLDHLREVLKAAVEKAKGRNGVHDKKAPETQVDKADRNKDKKGDKPQKLTASQKAKKAKKAKDAYEKEHPTSLSQDIKELHAQIQDIRAKIDKAMADARQGQNKAGNKHNSSGSQTKPDGPRGR